ncbi:MAG: hypothetical protein R3F11_30965 [Verrucomicrobiales bacterium]
MRPQRFFRMLGSAACTVWMAVRRFTSITASNDARSSSSSVCGLTSPTLFKIPSIGCAAATSAITSPDAARSPRSQQ